MATRILLVDNNRASLQNWSEVLRDGGFDVTKAYVKSVSSAREALDEGGFDLAILDLRLERDEDPSDDSGLRLAEEYRKSGGSVPIILLTAEVTKQALLWTVQENRSRADFRSVVDKSQGPNALLKEVRKVNKAVAMLKSIRTTVFLSHGHDQGARKEVVDFLEEGKIQVVVLQERPPDGKTIIERFESYANVHFAIVLFTPDDVGCERGKAPSELRHRARQNVIFELGYLTGKLGRSRVMALFKEEGEKIELPSNYGGIVFLEMDAECRWHKKLAEGMKRALTFM